MTDIGKLRDESGIARQVDPDSIKSARLFTPATRWFTARREAAIPSLTQEVQDADAAQRALHQASSRRNDLYWLCEIKRDILRLLKRANTHSAKALSL